MRAFLAADVQNDLSAVHHQCPIAERERGAHIMRHHQARQLLFRRDARGHGKDLLCRTGVERCGMLVEQQELRSGDRRHQKRQRLPLTAGQEPHRLPQPIFQAHIQLAQLRAEALAVPAADMPQPAAAAGRQRQVFFDRHPRCAAAHRILKQTADDLRPPIFRQERHILSVQQDLAAVRQKAAADGAEQRGFSRAVCADDRDKISVRHAERQLVQGALLVDRSGIEGLGDVLQLQHVSQPAFLCMRRRRTGSCVLRYGIEIASTTMTADTSFSMNAGMSSRSATV